MKRKLTHKNSIRLEASVEGRVWERVSMVVDGAPSKVVLLELDLEISLGSKGVKDSDGLSDDLGSYKDHKERDESA
jgi:hypothetical protein